MSLQMMLLAMTNQQQSGPAAVTLKWDSAGGTGESLTYSGGDLVATKNSGSWYGTAYSIALPNGKYYFEMTATGATPYANIGICQSKYDGFAQDGAAPWVMKRSSNAELNHSGWTGDNGSGLTQWSSSGTIRLEYAIDLPNNKIWIRENGGAWIGGGDPAAGTTPTAAGTMGSGTSHYLVANGFSTLGTFTIIARASQAHAAPSGFTAIGGTV